MVMEREQESGEREEVRANKMKCLENLPKTTRETNTKRKKCKFLL